MHENRFGRKFDQASITVLGFAQRVFGILARADILHCADHPYGLAVGVPYHEAPIEDGRVRRVSTAEAVLVRPGLPAGIDQVMNSGDDPLPVFGVDAFVPRADVRPDFLRRIAEQRLVRIIPPDRIVDQLPVPDDIVGCAREHPEPLDGTEQLLLGLRAFDRDAGE